jgi:hypothetical protein
MSQTEQYRRVSRAQFRTRPRLVSMRACRREAWDSPRVRRWHPKPDFIRFCKLFSNFSQLFQDPDPALAQRADNAEAHLECRQAPSTRP